MTANTVKTWEWYAPLSAGWMRLPAEATAPPPGLMAALLLIGGEPWPPMGILNMAIMATDTHMTTTDPTTTRYGSLHMTLDTVS